MGPYTHASRPIPAIGNIDKAEMDKIVRSENLYIQRAAHTMKDAFLMFREATWHTHILNVKHTTDLVIVDDPNKIGRWQGWFAHFPDHLTSSFSKDKAAVLSNMACYDIAHMKELIEQMLRGMEVCIEEVMFRLKMAGRRRTVVQYSDNSVDSNDYDHWFLRVTSRITGQQWAIDIAGAQYDIDASGIPWCFAEPEYIDEILAIYPFGTIERFSAEMAKIKSLEGMSIDVQAKAMEAFHAAVDPAIERKGLSWATILCKEDKNRVRHTNKVLKVGRTAIEAHVRKENLTKRRQKVERYEKRHMDELFEEKNKINDEILGYQVARDE